MSSPSVQPWRAVGISLGVALFLALAGWFTLNQTAFAAGDQPADADAVIAVNTTNPAIIDDNFCSLIEAIENANTDVALHDDCFPGSGDDTISLPDGAVITFTVANNIVGGSNALPVITSTITIVGNGATLLRDANSAPNFRFFNVAVGAKLSLINLTLTQGKAGLIGTNPLILGGGAIVSQGTVVISGSVFSANSASYGGAIYSEPVSGSLELVNTSFISNEAEFNGGAIYSFGPSTLEGGVLHHNRATVGGGALVHNSGNMTVTDAIFHDNTTAGVGAAIAAYAAVTDGHLWILTSNVYSNVAAISGGGIANSPNNGLTSIVQIENSTVTANRATSTVTNDGKGGGIVNGWWLDEGTGVAQLHVIRSYVANNVAQDGGGIANLDVVGYLSRTAEVFVSQSTVANNVAVGIGFQRGTGGGLFNSNGSATVVNSTISGNQASGNDSGLGGRGGGIGSYGRGITTTLRLLNATVAFNGARQAGGGVAIIGQDPDAETRMFVANSLIVSNTLSVSPTLSNPPIAAASPDVIIGTESCSVENGAVTSQGGSIEDGATCGFNPVIDQRNTVVPLGPLANNGGATPTHLIFENGPAFNAGIDALCAASPVNSVDQRGVTRPQGEGCDSGAVEIETVEPSRPAMYFPQLYLDHHF